MQKGFYKLKYSYFLTGFLLFFGFLSFAQTKGLVNNGAKIVLTTGSNIYINGTDGHYTNQNGGIITNNSTGGTITLLGNWTNNASNTVFSSGTTTTVDFKGATQSIGGTNATGFYNFKTSGTGIKAFNNVISTVSRLVTVNSGSVLNANGNLKLLADATSNASIGPLPTRTSVTNNVIVQSYFTGGSSTYRAFRGVSSPINDSLITGDKTYKQLQSKIIITGTGGKSKGFDIGNSVSPNAVTIKTYNEAAPLGTSQFTNLSDITNPTTSGKGFFLFYRGDRTNYDGSGTYATGSKIVGPNYTTPENVTAEYIGPINQGNVTVPLSYTNNNDGDTFIGSNLVGNPYPSAIDWHAVKSASTAGGVNISPYIYLIRQNGSFAIYNSEVGSPLSSSDGTRYIMPGQAFYVKANSINQNLVFTESCKDPYPSTGTVMRFLSVPESKFLAFGNSVGPSHSSSFSSDIKTVRLNMQSGSSTEETVIALKSGTTGAYRNNEDALYFGGGPIVFCSKSNDDRNLGVNVLPGFTEPAELKLYVAYSSGGKMKLNVTDVSSVGETQLFLQDSYLNKTENIQSNYSYEFEINNSISTSYGANRLKLLFRPMVVLSDFSAQKIYGGSEVKWSGVGENNSSMAIERSTNGKDFKVIGSMDRANDSKTQYTFVDSKPENGLNFYRLKLLEGDNKYSYTNTVSLNYTLDVKEPYFKIYPNPVKDLLNVVFKSEIKGAVLSVFNLSGQKLKTFTVSNANKVSYNLSDLEAGIYILKVVDDRENEVGTEKIIKD